MLDSPHSGFAMPADFGSVRTEAELREGEDCFIDELYQPAAARGVPLLAALFPRTYLDPNRHAGDIDPDLLAEPWPHAAGAQRQGAHRQGAGLAHAGRRQADLRPPADGGRAAVRASTRCHRPYHDTLRGLLDGAHARFGAVWHINCHSMGPTTSVLIEGVDGQPRADIVLGDRDGTTCAPEFTAFVRDLLAGLGYDVRVNDPFKGVELVRAYADPAAGRHSLQLEVNKRLYMDADRRCSKHAGFDVLQGHLMAWSTRILGAFRTAARGGSA